MGPLGIWELVIIFAVALIIFGPRKLPELGRSLGKSLSEFKRASNELRNTLDDEIRSEERRPSSPRPGSQSTASASPAQPAPTPSELVDPDGPEAAEPVETAEAEPEPAETVARGSRA